MKIEVEDAAHFDESLVNPSPPLLLPLLLLPLKQKE